jgi:arylsulfatase A-like enzyme
MRNILLISIDDLFSVRIFEKAFGIPIHTPNLDKISKQGMYFENAFCTTALCTPSRTAVLSGRNPFDTGVQSNSQNWEHYVDPTETLPAHFKQAGYNTSSFGKTYPSAPSFLVGTVLDRQYDRTQERADKDSATDDYVNVHKAIGYLETIAGGSDPYFMMVGLHDPHGPLTSPEQYYDLYPLEEIVVPKWKGDEPPEHVKQFLNTEEVKKMLKNGTMEEFVQSYLANISEMDARLGELLDGVKASGTDPIVVLYSDHGYSLGDHDHVHKFTLWEQATQVPLVIYDSQSPASHGVAYEDVVSLIDIGPTLLDMADLRVPGNWDGNSLADIVAHPRLPSEGEALTTMFGSISLRTNNWRITRYEDGSFELFHIASDPDNSDNLAGDRSYENEFEAMQDKLFRSVSDWGVEIRDHRDLVTVQHDNGDKTYYVNETSDLSDFSGSADTDFLQVSVENFKVPNWADDLTVSLRHAAGADLQGNDKPNVITVTDQRDRADGAGGQDFIYTSSGQDVAYGGGHSDYINGGKQDDRIFGDNSQDTLDGGSGHDTLVGGAGDDVLKPNSGNDELRGRGGADIFTFKTNSGEKDIITDFRRGTDKMDLGGAEWEDVQVRRGDLGVGMSVGGHEITLIDVKNLSEGDFI